MIADYDEHEAELLRAEDRWRRRHMSALLAHPPCRDPDHPGCESCEPELFTSKEIG
jgi:hypothetical protein